VPESEVEGWKPLTGFDPSKLESKVSRFAVTPSVLGKNTKSLPMKLSITFCFSNGTFTFHTFDLIVYSWGMALFQVHKLQF